MEFRSPNPPCVRSTHRVLGLDLPLAKRLARDLDRIKYLPPVGVLYNARDLSCTAFIRLPARMRERRGMYGGRPSKALMDPDELLVRAPSSSKHGPPTHRTY
jgi:hypothetical protein